MGTLPLKPTQEIKSLLRLFDLKKDRAVNTPMGLATNIKKADMIIKLVQALSFQVGREVNYHEVGSLVGIDPKTVVNYIDVLEKSFVVFRLNSFSKNQRNEIKKGVKIYFYDNGVRNAVIKNFNAIDTSVL